MLYSICGVDLSKLKLKGNMLMQTPDNLLARKVPLPPEYWEEKKKQELIRREQQQQEVLEARETLPNNKKLFNFDTFAGLYQRPSELEGRVSIHNIKEESKLNYEWKYWFNPFYADCKDEKEYVTKLYEIDEVR
ncbi:MAG: hypothetical protein NT091_04475 [Candidatus Falkowbacteria bacterium]|nr:hypothetical protein [Candidatus Falkowbacteria bacterium]